MIKENPYRLADDIAGVGFRTADEIAKRVGIREDSDFRIRSGILYTLLNASAEGHTCIPETMLLNRTGWSFWACRRNRWSAMCRTSALTGSS